MVEQLAHNQLVAGSIPARPSFFTLRQGLKGVATQAQMTRTLERDVCARKGDQGATYYFWIGASDRVGGTRVLPSWSALQMFVGATGD